MSGPHRSRPGGGPHAPAHSSGWPAAGEPDKSDRPDNGPERPEQAIEGTLERVVYSNPETLFTVARLAVSSGSDHAANEATGKATVKASGDRGGARPSEQLVPIVGPLMGVPEGTPLIVRGFWEESTRFGRQFRVRSYQTRSPETLVGIERYLSSGSIPGIGPELAKRMVARFGMKTLEVISQSPKQLVEVEGIGAARADKIAGAWQAQRGVQDVMVFLHSYGVTAAHAARIYKRYGTNAMSVIRQNPYRLALDIWGIGFKTADLIARNLGIESSAPERLQAGLVHALGQLAEDGHVHVPELYLLEVAAELLGVEIALLPPALLVLENSALVIRESLGDRGPCVSLTAMWESESDAAARLAMLVSTPMTPMKLDPAAAVAMAESAAGIELAQAQRRAVQAAVVDKCAVITGGPGVGKTTVVRAIVSIFAAERRRIALAAPTGRAAKRLSESTGLEALTLHRLLEYQPHFNTFARTEDDPLEIDALIVDEVSMVDIGLFRAFLAALPATAQLILVGDVDQLPSVGPGAVLADVIASGAATVVRLTEIFRQAAESRIVVAAHQINSGIVPELSPPPGQDAQRSDFYFIRRDDPVAARETLIELVSRRIPERFGFDPTTEIQVLSPIHRGDLGTIALNEALQAELNPRQSGVLELARGGRAFRIGDKVMQIKNDYEKAVFNGDIGVIRDIIPADKKLLVDYFDGRMVSYEQADLDQLMLAYAVSVHKSQGSEYPAVVISLATQHYMMLQRNLLYTAITRGKRLVVLIGATKAVSMAVRNQSTNTRWTWLAERIRDKLGEDEGE